MLKWPSFQFLRNALVALWLYSREGETTDCNTGNPTRHASINYFMLTQLKFPWTGLGLTTTHANVAVRSHIQGSVRGHMQYVQMDIKWMYIPESIRVHHYRCPRWPWSAIHGSHREGELPSSCCLSSGRSHCCTVLKQARHKHTWETHVGRITRQPEKCFWRGSSAQNRF